MSDPIVIVGCGNIGSRLLQSVSNTSGAREIYTVEPFEQAWPTAQERFSQENAGGHTLKLVSSPKELPSHAELIIFAMDARNRLQAMRDVLPECDTNKLLLEKVLFTRWSEYDQARELIGDKACWVNTSRNVWSGYHQLKSELALDPIRSFSVTGSDWGLGCNAIHFLSALEFLSGDAITSLSLDLTYFNIKDSKRRGYKELTGTLTGKTEGGTSVSIESTPDEGTPIRVTVDLDERGYNIREYKQEYEDSREPETVKPFGLYYTSQLAPMFEKIINNGVSDLPSFEASARLHGLLIQALNAAFYGQATLEKECPIT